MLESYSIDPDEMDHFLFRCHGSSKWIDFSTFLRFVDPREVGYKKWSVSKTLLRPADQAESAANFPPDFFDNPDEKRRPLFYPVSWKQFLVKSACTFGLYYFFWVYKTWNYIGTVNIKYSKRYIPVLFTILDPLSPLSLDIQRLYLAEYTNRGLLLPTFRDSFMRTLRRALFWLGFIALYPPLRFFIILPLLIPVTYLPLIKDLNDINAKRMSG